MDIIGNNYQGIIGTQGNVQVEQLVFNAPPTKAPVFANVPARPSLFVGREAIMAEIVARLTQQDAPVAISTQGMGGVGKTTLATMIAYHEAIRAHFSDGILWAGLGPQGEAMSQLAQWGDALRLDVRSTPDYATRHAAIKNRLGQGKYLLIIDDVWDEQTAQWLKCGGPNCRHVLTTRKQEIALTFDLSPTSLAELSPKAALELLQALAPKACAAQPDLARTLVQAVGYLPLAIYLLGGYLKATHQRVFPNQRLKGLTELQDPTRRLQLIQTALSDRQGLTLAQIIHLSLADLPATAVAAFYALAVFAPKPATLSLDAALTITQSSEDDLALLVNNHLLTQAEDNPEQLSLHQVMADLAQVELAKNPLRPERQSRHGAYYVAEANKDRDDWRHIETIYPQLKHTWEHVLNDERLELIAAIQTYQQFQGLWADQKSWLENALTFTNGKDKGTVLNNLGTVSDYIGKSEEALRYYEQALLAVLEVGDKVGYATTLNNIGNLYANIGQREDALRYYEQSLSIKQAQEDKAGYAMTLHNLGFLYDGMGQREDALRYYEQALPIMQKMGNKAGYAMTLTGIGKLYNDMGQREDALRYYEQALPVMQESGNKAGYATILNNLGLLYDGMGQREDALHYYEQALLIYQESGNKAGYAATLNNLGGLYDNEEALHYYEQALPILQEIGAKIHYASTLYNIGNLYDTLGKREDALRYYEQVLPIHLEVGDKTGYATTLTNIGSIYNAIGQSQKALHYYQQALPIHIEVCNRDLSTRQKRIAVKKGLEVK